MKKSFTTILIALTLCSKIWANPGDTTLLQVCKNEQVSYNGYYTYPELLPDTSKHYRKVFLTFTLGRYYCASGPTNCGAWDYIIEVFYVSKNGGDTVELSDMVTPYASTETGNPFDSSWRYNYLFDVTDFAPMLHDSGTFLMYSTGTSYGFTAGIKMTLIEGTPPREPILIKNAWATGTSNYVYGKLGDDINTQEIHPIGFKMPPGATQATLRTRISGHGNNSATGCSEFCSKYYKIFLNNQQLDSNELWRDCGYDNLGYPQTGTWLFNRGGWCPGASIIPVYHELTNLTPGDSFNMNLYFEPYPNPDSNSNAHYKVNTQVMFFKPSSFTLDASVENIKSPSAQSETYIYNPVCSSPIITISNTGTTVLTSLVITYGIDGDTSQAYTWTGSLAFLQNTDVALPPLIHYQNILKGSTFRVTISSPNGGTDQYALNNTMITQIVNVAPVWNNLMVVTLKTNNATSSITGYNETAYTIYDVNDNIVFQKNNLSNSHTYRDTIYLTKGCYKFTVTDDGCDGIDWWFYAYYNTNPGNGYLQIKELHGTTYYTPSHYHGGDFGCGFTDEFVVPDNTGVNNISTSDIKVRILNNLTDGRFYIQSSDELENVLVNIYDATGKCIQSYPATMLELSNAFDARNLSGGVYFVTLHNDKINTTMKLVIQHN